MKFLAVALVLGLQAANSVCAPIDMLGSVTNDLAARQNKGKGSTSSSTTATSTSNPSAKQVQTAADNFASDVSIVSNSLNTLGTATDQTQRVSLANAGFKAESNEDAQRSVLFAAGNNQAANTKIVDNTPTVLDGLSSIAKDPSDANVAKQLQTMETARNKNILPSITSLTNSAFKASGINSQAQTFQPTTGSQKLAAAAGSGTTGNTGTTTSSTGKATTSAKSGKGKNNN